MSILGRGQAFGIEECQVKLDARNAASVPLRSNTVTCCQNNSQVVFISHKAFSEFVLSDTAVEYDVKAESIIQESFNRARADEYQRTIWTAFSPDAKFAFEGPKPKSNLPKLKPIVEYQADKFEKEYMGIFVNALQERQDFYLKGADQQAAGMIRNRIGQAEKFF